MRKMWQRRAKEWLLVYAAQVICFFVYSNTFIIITFCSKVLLLLLLLFHRHNHHRPQQQQHQTLKHDNIFIIRLLLLLLVSLLLLLLFLLLCWKCTTRAKLLKCKERVAFMQAIVNVGIYSPTMKYTQSVNLRVARKRCSCC